MVPGGAGPSYMAAESHLAAVSYCPVAAIAVRLPRIGTRGGIFTALAYLIFSSTNHTL